MPLLATIDRLEESQAILILESGEQILWPKDKLPTNSQEGKALTITLELNETQTNQKTNLAKEFLNQILEK